MEFWGVEVKSGQPLKVTPGDGMVLHLSQANFGELKKEKGNESACLFVNVDGKKLVLGTLYSERLPQQQYDLVFDRDFELSHTWKSGSVYFYGYRASNSAEDFDANELPESEFDDSESEEDIPLTVANNGKPDVKVMQEKSAGGQKDKAAKEKKSATGKQKVKIVEPKKDESSDEEDFFDDDEDDSEDMDDSDDSEEETPKKVEKSPSEKSKKRAALESALKTPQEKKAKVTAQKTDGKKSSGHVATPHPAKQAGKTPANKPNQQSPKSGGSHVTCKSCNRGFGSDKALESHTKAKHG